MRTGMASGALAPDTTLLSAMGVADIHVGSTSADGVAWNHPQRATAASIFSSSASSHGAALQAAVAAPAVATAMSSLPLLLVLCIVVLLWLADRAVVDAWLDPDDDCPCTERPGSEAAPPRTPQRQNTPGRGLGLTAKLTEGAVSEEYVKRPSEERLEAVAHEI